MKYLNQDLTYLKTFPCNSCAFLARAQVGHWAPRQLARTVWLLPFANVAKGGHLSQLHPQSFARECDPSRSDEIARQIQ